MQTVFDFIMAVTNYAPTTMRAPVFLLTTGAVLASPTFALYAIARVLDRKGN